ncbi:hypothetical protein HRbin08_01196 [bacterium HR08]|nr:hypothetical protein HRbin08_01196 [bacterium HR08]
MMRSVNTVNAGFFARRRPDGLTRFVNERPHFENGRGS